MKRKKFLKLIQNKQKPLLSQTRSKSMAATKRLWSSNYQKALIYDPFKKKYIRICLPAKTIKTLTRSQFEK